MAKSKRLKLAIDDAQRLTDWMLWVHPVTPIDRQLNELICRRAGLHSDGSPMSPHAGAQAMRSRSSRRQRVADPSETAKIRLKHNLNDRLDRLGVPRRITLRLEQAGIFTLGDLLRTPADDLRHRHAIPTSMRMMIELRLREMGLAPGVLAPSSASPQHDESTTDIAVRVDVYPEEAERMLFWLQHVPLHFRTAADRRIGQSICHFLDLPPYLARITNDTLDTDSAEILTHLLELLSDAEDEGGDGSVVIEWLTREDDREGEDASETPRNARVRLRRIDLRRFLEDHGVDPTAIEEAQADGTWPSEPTAGALDGDVAPDADQDTTTTQLGTWAESNGEDWKQALPDPTLGEDAWRGDVHFDEPDDLNRDGDRPQTDA